MYFCIEFNQLKLNKKGFVSLVVQVQYETHNDCLMITSTMWIDYCAIACDYTLHRGTGILHSTNLQHNLDLYLIG